MLSVLSTDTHHFYWCRLRYSRVWSLSGRLFIGESRSGGRSLEGEERGGGGRGGGDKTFLLRLSIILAHVPVVEVPIQISGGDKPQITECTRGSQLILNKTSPYLRSIPPAT